MVYAHTFLVIKLTNTMKNMNKYKFFWGSTSPFSNWYLHLFVHKGQLFNCSEQAMMYYKAKLFNDNEAGVNILAESNPRIQKQLGRTIKNFDDVIWKEKRYDIVKDILRSKFSGSSELLGYLREHKDFTIVEASPYDRIWGIGYDAQNALANIDKWGENLLGKILTELANEL